MSLTRETRDSARAACERVIADPATFPVSEEALAVWVLQFIDALDEAEATITGLREAGQDLNLAWQNYVLDHLSGNVGGCHDALVRRAAALAHFDAARPEFPDTESRIPSSRES